jgi:hypothetical protein
MQRVRYPLAYRASGGISVGQRRLQPLGKRFQPVLAINDLKGTIRRPVLPLERGVDGPLM